jgi:hypothetical protein
VQAELVADGLQVSVVPVETGEASAGQVLSVEPVGNLAPATVVTVGYAVPPVAVPVPEVDEDRGNDGNGNGNGNGKGKDKKDD